jgi:TPR repeat protein
MKKILLLAMIFFGFSWGFASANPEAEADYTLGMKYYTGTGNVYQDFKQAAEWFRKAAELGLAKGQYRLGFSYDSGQGVAQDYQAARQWYLKAAAQSDRDAEAALGDLYSLGHGVKKDVAEAAGWYFKAAEQGVAHAQYELGKLYFSGEGVKQDYTQAYIWLGLAAKEIDDAMDRRDESGEHLTPDQLRAAREHIERWHPALPVISKKQKL